MRLDSVRLNAVVLISGAVLMALEILGSRVLAPSYGSSVYVWGSLISTFLFALSFGYALGGKLADRRPSPRFLALLLAVGAVLILPSVLWAPKILETIGRAGWDPRWGALVAAFVLFLPPSVVLGMVTPFAVRLAIRGPETAGTVAGGYSALSTAGSIAGTLATTFFLIPRFPVHSLLLGLSASLLLCAAILMRGRGGLAIAMGGAAALAFAFLGQAAPHTIGGERVLIRKDTAYHHIAVTQLDSRRWMRFDTLTQSGVDLAHPERSLVGYDEALLAALAFRPGIRRVCVIGLGGGSFQRAFARLRPEAKIDTVEIDPVVRGLALEYFLYRESDRMRTVIEDGRVFLAKPGPSYDLIVLDAFNSTGVPFHLTTREFFEIVRRRLSPDGIFAANFVGQLMGKDGRLFWATYHTIRRQFGQVYVASWAIRAGRAPSAGNLMVYATVSADMLEIGEIQRRAAELAARWNLENVATYMDALVHAPNAPGGIPELSDAYAPVEALQNF